MRPQPGNRHDAARLRGVDLAAAAGPAGGAFPARHRTIGGDARSLRELVSFRHGARS